MAALKLLVLIVDSDISGSEDEFFTDAVADGESAKVQLFGAAIPGTGMVAIYWGSDTEWRLIRAIAQGTWEFAEINQDFLGDGVSRFKLVRTKQGGSGPLAIKSWFKAVANPQ